ncbi:MAG: pyruvate kinase [Firmicutes bacterium]|nr:pyruvate kinase [Bacillota bacterium]
MRKTKIVCTLGPASESPEIMTGLIEAGMNVARLNLSHGSRDEHARRIETLRQACARLGRPVAVMLDTKGPEIRLGEFRNGSAVLEEGAAFTLTTREVLGDSTIAHVQHPGFPRDVHEGGGVLLDDGNIGLSVLEVGGTDVRCRVLNGGVISNRKKVNLPDSSVSLPALSDKDIDDLRWGVAIDVDFIAASFIRKESDVLAIRRIIEEAGGCTHIISKIESREGVSNLDEILKVSDGLMVARGDLGVEIPPEDVPLVQKTMIDRCNRLGKPVITATQMLESMINKPRPTRAEASDVANAIFDGTDAVMLSAETASGKYPVEATAMMARIAERAETALRHDEILVRKRTQAARTVTEAISSATAGTANDLGAACVITATESGHTARMVSKYRPRAPVLAVTPRPDTVRKLLLVWGVFPTQITPVKGTDEMVDQAVLAGLEKGLIKKGDLVVITAGVPVGIPGTTNLIKVHTVGDIPVRGTGIGSRPATGRACIAKTATEAAGKFHPGDILVTIGTDSDFVPFIREASGIIAEEGGLTSHAAIAALQYGIPAVVGAQGATSILRDLQTVTIDATRGLIYLGEACV